MVGGIVFVGVGVGGFGGVVGPGVFGPFPPVGGGGVGCWVVCCC